MDETPEERSVKELHQDSMVIGTISPRSALSPRNRTNVQGNEFIDTSIEQLCENVCDMESSGQSSPSRHSFGSYGEESIADSEFYRLIGNSGTAQSQSGKSDDSSGDSKKEDDLDFKESKKSGDKNETISLEKPQSDQKDDKDGKISDKAASKKKKLRNGLGAKNLKLGFDLLNQVKDLMSAGENHGRALELALQAQKSFEACKNGKPGLELVMCLHIIASKYSSLGRQRDAISVLNRSIRIPAIEDGPDHALAEFSGHMQLGDTYMTLGQIEDSIRCYISGLEIQKRVLGEKDPRLIETYVYLSEAYIQALKLDEAEKLCNVALDIHRESNWEDFLEKAGIRRFMALIFKTKGDHEQALEQLILASAAITTSGQDSSIEAAYISRSIGDAYLVLGRYEEAVSAYEKSLAHFKTLKEDNHPVIGSVLLRLADTFDRSGKLQRAKSCCEDALWIYENAASGADPEEIASGFTEVSAVYESMNEFGHAVDLLRKALEILYSDEPLHWITIAGIEGQIGAIHYTLGEYSKAYEFLMSSVTKLRDSEKGKSVCCGAGLNLMGLINVHWRDLDKATELFKEARGILEAERGTHHQDTLVACSNLAGVYDVTGRFDDAIEVLKFVVAAKEEELGMADPEMEKEKQRLRELVEEAGRVRGRSSRNLRRHVDE